MYNYSKPPDYQVIVIDHELREELANLMRAYPEGAQAIQAKVTTAIKDVIEQEKYEASIRQYWKNRRSQ